MTNYVTPIDVQDIVKDLRRIVVNLKEDDKVTQSLTYAHRIADIIHRRGGDTLMRYIPGQDTEKEQRKSRNRQLRDLDNENRQLRQLYEDSQWTLFLVMEAHRRVLEANFEKDSDKASSGIQNRVHESMKQDFCKDAAQMAREIQEYFEYTRKMNVDIRKRVEDLRAENDLLRAILDFESGVDIQTITDQLKKRASKSPLQNAKHGFESSSGRENIVNCDEKSAPRTKTQC
ncbi:hypothetical protein KIN20_024739 [Parelaphostrongylus tenuis]|uniref:Uncharacterized protein n=1 Tax=Parelaphostrongylus tenuis TaxID=148309 RepID=A0AAD5QW67_PARTN|nr:hypothetical protein KIN20_024739 [Parelaphostrongylus tenuis]